MNLQAVLTIGLMAFAVRGFGQTAIDATNWGNVTAPVFGKFESGAYSDAELFAGPRKFGGAYDFGVLPSGRIVKPTQFMIPVGMNPTAGALTPDTRYFVVMNSSERNGSYIAYRNNINTGGYSLSVIDLNSLTVVSTYSAAGSLFGGLQVTGFGPYTIFAAGGADNSIKMFDLSARGVITPSLVPSIPIPPIQSSTDGLVSNYVPDSLFNLSAANGYFPAVADQFNRTAGAQMTFPAGMAVGPDGRYLYVACNGDNSIAVIDMYQKILVAQLPAGYSPYGVAVSADGSRVFSTNSGVMAYKFANATYDVVSGKLTANPAIAGNVPDGFYVPKASVSGENPLSSSVSIYQAPGGNGANLAAAGAFPGSPAMDDLQQVGGTHPAGIVAVKSRYGGIEMLFFAKANSDSLGMIRLDTNTVLPDLDLSFIPLTLSDGHKVHGTYPTALVVSPDTSRLYVAESGINSVAVFDITRILAPQLLGRIPTGWLPTSLTLTSNGQYLFVTNAKGVGEDINPNATVRAGNQPATGIASDAATDSTTLFGTVQIVDALNFSFDSTAIPNNNYSIRSPGDASIVPVGGAASTQIKHVFVIVHESKTFDSLLGNQSNLFGAYASQSFQTRDGISYLNQQYTAVVPNMQSLAHSFATAVNFYADAEEGNAGAQILASGTSTDYTQRMLPMRSGRGLLANRNAEPEDYPEGGYIFNNAARNGVSFKSYGMLTGLAGSDNGGSDPASGNDAVSGLAGYPQLQADKASLTNPVSNVGDVSSPTQGLAQSYFLATPGLAVLGGKNARGEPRLDLNYPGVNFNISDQRRALEFIQDFDRMARAGTVPQLIYIYQPNDATGLVSAPNAKAIVANGPLQQVADGDAALGMVVSHLMNSPTYYDVNSNTGSAIFVTYSSAQSTNDHIHPHRSLLVVISPFAKPGFIAARHYSSASVVKTAELLLGLPPNNLGDLLATDLRDMFQPTYNGVSTFVRPTAVSPDTTRATIGQSK